MGSVDFAVLLCPICSDIAILIFGGWFQWLCRGFLIVSFHVEVHEESFLSEHVNDKKPGISVGVTTASVYCVTDMECHNPKLYLYNYITSHYSYKSYNHVKHLNLYTVVWWASNAKHKLLEVTGNNVYHSFIK